MLREQVEARLRALAIDGQPVFKTIESATNLDSVIKGNRIAADTAFIVPMADRGAPQELTTMRFQQHIQATVGVVIACRNINDTFGKDAIERLEYLKQLVRKHLLGWEPDGMETLLFDQGRIVSFSASAAFWLEQYRCRYTFRG
ncbi:MULTISPECIES: phage tail terminator protein [Idiomarina]|jgi:hypothetical protein|uniref:phage tail terminator protein n=1 Tax=Idiomarina TaxID=135575 RepID=UPI00129B0730|nr:MULTISPECIES: hypothetical protein [Idiomarina]MRJ41193.1 hypothetical protein [Idiomarina sp. FeN1]NCU56358.1 hypothetical protein [Idiomarina sp. FenA--70]NCU59377.1 hypothetical protein [Idiomarina sp. FenBw--71]UUN12552.1 hypothetical protein KGF88_07740 [Idiomarina loihiensis]